MPAGAPRLESSIRKCFLPYLKEDGFRGSGRTFRRVINDWIQVVNFQGSMYGGQFAINLGLHHVHLPIISGPILNPEKIREYECGFRRRLSDSDLDKWWKHDSTESSMDAAVTDAAEVYLSVGRPLLNNLGALESAFDSVTPGLLDSKGIGFLGFTAGGDVLTALALARLRKLQRRQTESKAFAAYGLTRLVGTATALKTQLERLLKD